MKCSGRTAPAPVSEGARWVNRTHRLRSGQTGYAHRGKLDAAEASLLRRTKKMISEVDLLRVERRVREKPAPDLVEGKQCHRWFQ